ncbi:MAG: hypothetical protein K8H86_12460 [Ignavibacteriaceae bacterium]|nr:hypothetical protein [Ignavibacteriaceae bacterium]
MSIKHIATACLLIVMVLLPAACRGTNNSLRNSVVIAITPDVESLNPLYSFTYYEGMISELLYLSLVQHDWDFEQGELATKPMLAESYTWSDDSSSIKIKLRGDVFWSDGKRVSTEDVVTSFLLYSNPDVQSRFFGMFKNFYLLDNLTIDKEKTFTVDDSLEFSIHFKESTNPSLVDIDMPIIPAHVFANIPPHEIINKEKELTPVTNGPYNLSSWNINQSIVLTANTKCFLQQADGIKELIFKIVPDYNSGLIQLKNNEINILEGIRPADAKELKMSDELIVAPIEGRDYDYLGWSNIDVDVYKRSGKKIPHKLFGSSSVRKALALAINRQEILIGYFNNFGQIASGPVAPVFKAFYNTSVVPYPFNPNSAKMLLKSAGWVDADGDGILEKGKVLFSFTIFMPAGNASRDFASTVIKNNLKAIGADVKIEMLEPGVFFEKMFNRELDAWIAGWSVPIPIELKAYWHSNLEENQLNISGFNNAEADGLLEKISSTGETQQKNKMIEEFQNIIHQEEPVTFLYWIDNITAHTKAINGIHVSPLGVVHHPWNWTIK